MPLHLSHPCTFFFEKNVHSAVLSEKVQEKSRDNFFFVNNNSDGAQIYSQKRLLFYKISDSLPILENGLVASNYDNYCDWKLCCLFDFLDPR